MVDITVGLMYKPNMHKLPDIYRKLGMDYAERVLPSLATEVAKSVVVCNHISWLYNVCPWLCILISVLKGSIYCF